MIARRPQWQKNDRAQPSRYGGSAVVSAQRTHACSAVVRCVSSVLVCGSELSTCSTVLCSAYPHADYSNSTHHQIRATHTLSRHTHRSALTSLLSQAAGCIRPVHRAMMLTLLLLSGLSAVVWCPQPAPTSPVLLAAPLGRRPLHSSSSYMSSHLTSKRDAGDPNSVTSSYSIVSKYSDSSSAHPSSSSHLHSSTHSPHSLSSHRQSDTDRLSNGTHSLSSAASSRYANSVQRDDDEGEADGVRDNVERRRGDKVGSRDSRYLSAGREAAAATAAVDSSSALAAPPGTARFFNRPSSSSSLLSSLHSNSSPAHNADSRNDFHDERHNRLFVSRTSAAANSFSSTSSSLSSASPSLSDRHDTLPFTASADRVPLLLRALVVDVLGKQQSPTPPTNARIDALRSYCLRLLSSRLTSAHSSASSPLSALQDAVHSAVTAISPSEGAYAAELLQRFSRRDGIRDKARVLQLLLACKDTAETARGVHDSFALSVATSAFPIAQPLATPLTPQPKVDLSRQRTTEQLPSLLINHSTYSAGGGHAAEVGQLTDAELVRDLLYTFQAIDGRKLHFHSPSLSYRLTSSALQLVSPPRQRLVARLSQLGALYKLVCGYVNNALERGSGAEKERARQSITAVYGHHSLHPPPTPSRHAALMSIHSASTASSSGSSLRPIGLMEQSFVASLQSELTDYFRWVSVIEAQHLQAPDELTLHRLWLAVQQPLSRLIILATLSGSAATLHGGALLNCLANARQHGSSTVQSLVSKLLNASCAPLFHLIQHWLRQGDIHDAHSEFFIAVDQSVPSVRLWSDKYRVRRSMLPSFIPLAVAEQILVVGKSVNFIRQCCQDTTWQADSALDIEALLAATTFTDASSLSSLSSSSSPLSREVAASASLTNAHLLSLMLDKYHFLRHVRALKSYLLMSAGDFIEQLLSQLHSELHKPGAALNPRHLTFLLDQAVRASNARFEPPDVLHRLSIKVHRSSSASSSSDESGWEAFTLDYLIDSPLNVIITPASMAVYLRVFAVLWRLKRVEWELKDVWMRQSSHRYAIEEQLLGVAGGVYDGMRHLMAGGYELRQAMWHLLSNLSSYFMFQVLESSWRAFEAQVKAGKEMDDLIAAHRMYVQQISDKALLTGVAAPLSAVLLPLLDDMLRFAHTQQVMYDEAVHECSKRQTYTLSKQPSSGKDKQAVSAESSRRGSVEESIPNRRRSVSAAEVYLTTSGALMDSGVFVGMLPRWQDELDRQRLSFHQHTNQLLLALDAAIEKGHTNIRAQQQQQQQKQEEAPQLSDVMQTPARTTLVEGRRPAGPAAIQRPASSAYMGELEFLRLRLDYNHFYTSRTQQQHTTAHSHHTASSAVARLHSTPISTHRTSSALRSSSAVANGGSVAASSASTASTRPTGRASSTATQNGAEMAKAGLPPRPRQQIGRRTEATGSGDDEAD